MVFRPCLRMVKRENNHIDKPQGLRYIPAPSKPSIFPTGKKHVFPYREEKKLQLQRNKSAVDIVKKEFKLLANIGFVKKNDNIPNKKLLEMTFVRNQFGILQMDDDNITNSNIKGKKYYTTRQIRDMKRNEKNKKETEHQKDVDYVSNLNKWDNKVFPIINSKNNK